MVGLFSFLLCWVFVALHRLRGFSCPRACRILTPQPEIKPGSPALEGGFLTIGPRVKVIVAQLCLTVCDPMDCSPPGSSVCGILQAKTLEWVAIPFSRGSSWPRDWTWFSGIAGRFFTIWVIGFKMFLNLEFHYFTIYSVTKNITTSGERWSEIVIVILTFIFLKKSQYIEKVVNRMEKNLVK